MEFSGKQGKANREKLREIRNEANKITQLAADLPNIKQAAVNIESMVVDLLVEN